MMVFSALLGLFYAECEVLMVEHIEWTDVEALFPLCLMIVCIFTAIYTVYIFAKHNDTAIVKASTRELSYVILGGIILAYL